MRGYHHAPRHHMYRNPYPPMQAVPIAPSPSFQPMYVSQPVIAGPIVQPMVQPMHTHMAVAYPPPIPQPVPQPIPQPVNGSMVTTQQNLDETSKPVETEVKSKKCAYCGQQWSPLTVSKISTSNTAIGTILGLCGILPGVLYCFCTRKKLEACGKCRKVERDDDYCCEC